MYTQIKVRHIDGSEGMIDTPRLEELIDSGEISHFRRSEGWIDINGAKTRVKTRERLPCAERRRDCLARQPVFRAAGTVAGRSVISPGLGGMSSLLAAMYKTLASFL